MEHPKAEAYERRYPETGVGEAQKIERMERMEFKARRADLHVTRRSRFTLVPELPWLKEKDR